MARGNELTQEAVEQLVERAKTGDRRAFGRLVDEYKDKIYNYVARMLNDPYEAEDVTQEAFLRAFRSLPRFRGASSFHTWLYRIASNLAIDVVRRRKRQEPTFSLDEPLEGEDGEYDREIPDETGGPEEASTTRETRVAVRRAIMDLPEKLRDVMILYELQGETYEDIAEILDVPLGTVKSRLFNARNRLKDELEELVAAGEIEVER
ncbi:MAG: sigma-70 family RNA polymerase sigma factor [Armatimonadota bacterium]|nr:sigma-70 family RNA polymerase sigma factor [Armatimonadota bacterium]